MQIKFIKGHDAGIKEGIEKKVGKTFGERMVKEGFAEEVAAEKPKRGRKPKAKKEETKED